MPDIINVRINPKPANKYNILLGAGVINDYKEWLPSPDECSTIVIITDKILENLHAKKFKEQLDKSGYKTLLFVVKAGEDSKSFAVKEKLELEMLKNKCDRKTILIAFGGGVIGDLTGFLAATYMRGIRFIQVPTTLLSAIDSSVGGKTGINTPYGKNLIGAIWQPIAVITDLDLLKTLPQMHLVNGLIEAIKIFLTLDLKSFNYFVKNLNKILKRDEKVLQSVIRRSVKLKAQVVRLDEREENLRMILNFGHTVGHAIEKSSNYEILHGLCVGMGILVEAKIAVLMNKLEDGNFAVIKSLLLKLGLNQDMLSQFNKEELINNMLIDKKNKNGGIHAIILNGLGSVYTENGRFATKIESTTIHKAFTILL